MTLKHSSAAGDEVGALVEHLFRHEAGRMTSILTRLFGLAQIELAEDIVQDTLQEALQAWSVGPLPDNPAGWLMAVAKRKTINLLRREKVKRRADAVLLAETSDHEAALDEVFLDAEIRDSQLRMIFTCCHPDLPPESQIALTLKTLAGFSVPEIADALLSNVATINKRLYRAKQKFRSGEITLESPQGERLLPRLDAVSLTLYLLFNEGYNSNHAALPIRRELCAEAIRLAAMVVEHFPEVYSVRALLALMCLHAARFDARLDEGGAIVIFEDQNRAGWDVKLIDLGLRHLAAAGRGEALSAYHLEAGIAAEHCIAADYGSTNWPMIEEYYNLLLDFKPHPIVKLNRAIAVAMSKGFRSALPLLHALENEPALQSYSLLFATLGEFYRRCEDEVQARSYLMRAREMTESRAQLELLDKKIKQLSRDRLT